MPQVLSLGTRFRKVYASVGTIDFVSNTTQTLELPRSFLYRTLYILLTGAVDKVAGVQASVGDELPLPLLKRVEVIGDGRKQFVSATGRSLYRLGHQARAIEPQRTFPDEASIIGAGAITAGPVTTLIPVDFEAARMRMAADSFLDPRPFEKMELRITWGALTDLVDADLSETAGSPIQAEVFIEETTMGAEIARFNRLLISQNVPINASNAALTVRVPRAGLLAGMLVSSLGGTAGKKLDDGIVNHFSLRSDSQFLHVDFLTWNQLRALGSVEQLMAERVQPSNTVLPTGDDFVAAPTLEGHAYVDLTEDGLLSSALNTIDLNTLDLVLDVTSGASTDNLEVTYVFYEPVS